MNTTTNIHFPSLTFGIEFEAILAFHQSDLQYYLTKTSSPAAIIKIISPSVRKALNNTSTQHLLTRPTYHSWGLTAPVEYSAPDASFEEKYNADVKKYGYRGYAGEILELA